MEDMACVKGKNKQPTHIGTGNGCVHMNSEEVSPINAD